MKKTQVLILGMLIAISSQAQKKFDFNPECVQAYQEVSKLKIKPGKILVEKLLQQQPNNLVPVLIKDYIDFYTLFLNEDPAYYEEHFPDFQDRLEQVQSGPKDSPFYLYSQALIRIHRAGVSIKFGHLWDAGWDFRKAYMLLKENKKTFPQFAPNDLLFGAVNAVVGTVPKGYRWLTNLLGIHGSLSEGMRMVRQFAYSNDPWAKMFFTDAAFIYPYLLFHIENKKEEALQFISQRKLDLVNNHLLAFMASNLYLNNKNVEETKTIITSRNKSEDYLAVSIWDFEMGYIKLYHLETSEALGFFEQFTSQFKGKFYVKDVYQKISWCYYLQNNFSAAENARKLAIKKGSTDSDADKKALKDAKAMYWPNPLLLKARLLNDGGYHTDAYKLLSGKTDDDFPKEEEKLEFAYRVARILDDLNKPDDAIRNYLIAIRIGENRREYYAARAALQIGLIYENRNQKKLAIAYYQKCINMEDHEYKNSLDQRAKAGIERCKGE
ncbi:MAG: tetratricopeptide repeat protein [Chitinophagaceae bacterium]|nr:tetratricopeptide repeat protein [Chitinophagaceae bacterium]